MVPVELDDDDQLLLGVGTASELVTYAKEQPEYLPLPTAQFKNDARRPVISRWSPTPEERAALAAGEDLYLEAWMFDQPALQPVKLTVGCPTKCPTS